MRNNTGFDDNFPNFEEFTSSFKKADSTSFNNSDNFNNLGFNEDSPLGNIDMNTILKIKQIIEKMNNTKNNPRSNLLLSLKPYLKPSRKQKIDQYIQLFSMGEILGNLNSTGGEQSK